MGEEYLTGRDSLSGEEGLGLKCTFLLDLAAEDCLTGDLLE
jgi:hypothetical protein